MSIDLLLREARQLGFLGPGPVEPHVVHAQAYAAASTVDTPELVIDLGSGGGLPALALASIGFGTHWVLVERSETRADWLRRAVRRLNLAERVEVLCAGAETVVPDFIASADVVTARSFAPLGITVEIAAPLLRSGGELIVSLEANYPLDPSQDVFPALAFEVLQVHGFPFCRARRRPGVAAALPRSWRAMQRRPIF